MAKPTPLLSPRNSTTEHDLPDDADARARRRHHERHRLRQQDLPEAGRQRKPIDHADVVEAGIERANAVAQDDRVVGKLREHDGDHRRDVVEAEPDVAERGDHQHRRVHQHQHPRHEGLVRLRRAPEQEAEPAADRHRDEERERRAPQRHRDVEDHVAVREIARDEEGDGPRRRQVARVQQPGDERPHGDEAEQGGDEAKAALRDEGQP